MTSSNPSSLVGGSKNGDKNPTDDVFDHPLPLIFPALGKHTHTLILLHGRGDDAQSFAPQFLVSQNASGMMLEDYLPGLKFIFPTAKKRVIWQSTIGNKQVAYNQWFDIVSLEDTTRQEDIQLEGLRESSLFVHSLIREEMKLIPCKNIILGGLSQGCATSLYTMLTFEPPKAEIDEEKNRLGAVIGISGWLPFPKVINQIFGGSTTTNPEDPLNPEVVSNVATAAPSTRSTKQLEVLNMLRHNIGLAALETTTPAALSTPVFMGHGTADGTIDVKLGEYATSSLRLLGIDVTWTPYEDFHHWYKVPEEIDDVVEFMKKHTDLKSV